MRSVALLSMGAVAQAKMCTENGMKQAYWQLTAQTCDCCMPLEEFVMQNDFVHSLFYSRQGRLNMKIKADFEATAEDWKHSKVAFGMIDVDTDRKMY
eukprot:gene987-339_t